MATGRVGATGGDGQDIATIATDLDAELNISAAIVVGGPSGTTTEPCFGFVHTKITGTATTDVDNAVAAVAAAEYLPGEVAQA